MAGPLDMPPPDRMDLADVAALPRHQPQEVARQAVTLDRLSGGRMVLGVGLGEAPSEYTASAAARTAAPWPPCPMKGWGS